MCFRRKLYGEMRHHLMNCDFWFWERERERVLFWMKMSTTIIPKQKQAKKRTGMIQIFLFQSNSPVPAHLNLIILFRPKSSFPQINHPMFILYIIYIIIIKQQNCVLYICHVQNLKFFYIYLPNIWTYSTMRHTCMQGNTVLKNALIWLSDEDTIIE